MYYARITDGLAYELENALYVWDANNYCTPHALVADGKSQQFGVVTLKFVPAPEHNSATHLALRDGCEFVEGQWQYKWRVDALTSEQIESKRLASIPAFVTMRQARLALLGAGLLDTVETAIAGAGPAAKIEWDYATEVQRSAGLVPQMATALGMTAEQIDALFVAAAAL